MQKTLLPGKTKRVINKNQKRQSNKVMMRTKQLFKAGLLSFIALCSMALTMASCANEDIAQNGTGSDNDKNFTTFVAGAPKSRTSLDYNTSNFYWEEGDKIYVQDDDGHWQTSNAVDAAHAHSTSFTFKVLGKFENSATYRVYYPGKNGSNNQVSIPTAQTQTVPNSTTHFGTSGDCGVADATGTIGGDVFSFQLEHQAAILVLEPYMSNDNKLKSTYLTKIEVSSDNDIAGSYTISPVGSGSLTGSGGSKQITLTTMNPVTGSANEKGFPLTNTAVDVPFNGAYMLIKPGTHTLKGKYWIKDYVTNVEAVITKTLPSFSYDKNNYYDMAANFNITNYDGHHYYMWDAKNNCWHQHEWDITNISDRWQPTLNNESSTNYPQAGDALDRYYNTSITSGGEANQNTLFSTLPNANEMGWYCMEGDPRWDANRLWTVMGHLYKGGMWFLKEKEIAMKHGKTITDLKNAGPDNKDHRTIVMSFTNNSLNTGLPTNIQDYFFLPALGYYMFSQLKFVGRDGAYWSSSADPSGGSQNACGLVFRNNVALAYTAYPRAMGNMVQKFE